LDEISQIVPDTNYHQLQHFVSDSPWSGQNLVDEVAQSTHRELKGKERLLIIDEVGEPKTGDKSVGTARQYCGNSGKVDNCQVSVAGFLSDFHQGSLVDMKLYLPKSWTDDIVRMERVGIPKALHAYKTKIEIATDIIDHQINQHIDFKWVVADGFYGRDLSLANHIDEKGKQFVLEVAKNRKVYLEKPVLKLPEKNSKKGRPFTQKQPDQPAIVLDDYYQSLGEKDFKKTRIRDSFKGNLIAYIHTCKIYVWDQDLDRIITLRLLIRKDGSKVGFAFSNAHLVSDQQILKVQAWRYFIERAFQEAKNVVGMKHLQVRKYQAWIHYMAMILLLLLFLMKLRQEWEKQIHPLISYRDLKLCLQWFLPQKCDHTNAFIQRLFDNLFAKMCDFLRYEHDSA